jgi:pimeloyl-ACP methyl ester carboxylesterase
MTQLSGAECRWQVHGLSLAGLAWGKPDNPPLLCLHGWLDNATSFEALASGLPNYYVVAPDLTGHGQSDRRSPDATYQIWDDLPEVTGIVEALGWERFRLLGHSRGAIISALFAATFPEKISHLVLLDALMPQPVAESEFPLQMRRFLQDKGRLLGRENRVFDSVDAAVASRRERGITAEAAALLAARNLRPTDGGYTWTTDPRLQGASAVKLTEGQIDAVLAALDMPTLLLLAEEGIGGHRPEVAALARRCIRHLEVMQVAGNHHCHMEAAAGAMSRRIAEFFEQ